jgi:hypothetical protein
MPNNDGADDRAFADRSARDRQPPTSQIEPPVDIFLR